MAKDAVWIIVTIPKKEFEKSLSEKRYLKKGRYDGALEVKRHVEEDPLEKTLENTLQELGIETATWISDKSGDRHHVYFAVDLYDNDYVLSRLKDIGVGVKRETSLGYIPFGLFFTNDDDLEGEPELDDMSKFALSKSENGFKKVQQEFLKSVTSRLTVAQVVEGVRSGASLTFDFLAYTTFAGFIAAAGLLNNSAVDIAAAMMIEPIMSTVMAICFGAIIHDRGLARLGFINLCIVLLICIVIGFLYGLVFMTWSNQWNPPPEGVWPTPEMEVRGTWRALIYGLLQAMGAGGAVAITLLNDAQCPLVGVAVASTFLPPHINTGLLWAYSCHLEWRGLSQDYVTYNTTDGRNLTMKPAWIPQANYKTHYYDDMRYESIALGGVSLILTYVNVIGMIFVAYIMLWLKQVVPMGKMDSNKRFFKEDIKVARYYNRKSMAVTTDDAMGKQILQEWAEIAGLDPSQLLSQKPEAKITQLQTLRDLLGDVENDDVYRSVTKGAMGRPENGPNLLRRLTQATIQGSRRSSTSQGTVNFGFRNDPEMNLPPVKGRRGYTINSSRRSSNRWGENNNDTIHSESSFGRGLRPVEMEPQGRRKSSVALQRQLQESDHSPFSVWPSNSARPTPDVSELRRRMSSIIKVDPPPKD